jgi:TDG/mug DNA glycosylase family protein
VFVGYNPGLESARLGHYYAHRGNAFWRHLNASGLVSREVSLEDDAALMDLAGIGFTDLCPRPTLRASELTPAECAEGALRLRGELEDNAPAAAVFGGKQLYELFARHTSAATTGPFAWGRQPATIAAGRTALWVIPSSSGLASKWHGERLRLLRALAGELGPWGRP